MVCLYTATAVSNVQNFLIFLNIKMLENQQHKLVRPRCGILWYHQWVPHIPGITSGSLMFLVSPVGPSYSWYHQWVPHIPGITSGSLIFLVSPVGPLYSWYHKCVPHVPGITSGSLIFLVSPVGSSCSWYHWWVPHVPGITAGYSWYYWLSHILGPTSYSGSPIMFYTMP